MKYKSFPLLGYKDEGLEHLSLWQTLNSFGIKQKKPIWAYCTILLGMGVKYQNSKRIKKQNWSESNRLSSTIGGNRYMNKLYTTSQVSNITRKTENKEHIKWILFNCNFYLKNKTIINNFFGHKNRVDNCDVRIQLY